jgi:hypothetical protein
LDVWNELPGQQFIFPAMNAEVDYDIPVVWLEQFKYAVWQLEQGGNTNRLHIQMYLQHKNAHSMAKWRKLVPGNIEIQRGTNDEAANYCKKQDETFVRGFWEHGLFSTGQGARNDLEAAKEAALAGATREELLLNHTSVMIRGAHVMDELIEIARKRRVSRPVVFNPPNGVKEWHQFILYVITQPVDKRKVYWVYDAVGNAGKSYLAGHIATKVPTFIAAEGSYKDLFLAYGKMGCPGVVILDIPRTGKVGDPQCVESWKNGAAFSSKYQSRMLEFDAPHVFIFSNQSCEPGIFSIDRLVRIELHDGEWTMASRALADAACPGCVYAVQELV